MASPKSFWWQFPTPKPDGCMHVLCRFEPCPCSPASNVPLVQGQQKKIWRPWLEEKQHPLFGRLPANSHGRHFLHLVHRRVHSYGEATWHQRSLQDHEFYRWDGGTCIYIYINKICYKQPTTIRNFFVKGEIRTFSSNQQNPFATVSHKLQTGHVYTIPETNSESTWVWKNWGLKSTVVAFWDSLAAFAICFWVFN